MSEHLMTKLILWRQSGSFLFLVIAAMLTTGYFAPSDARAQEGLYLSEDEAPKAIFPDADEFKLQILRSEADLREKIKSKMGRFLTSLWEDEYKVYVAKKSGKLQGYGVIVEEIGKHRPITFIVGVRPTGKIQDVAVMVFREPQGGEVRSKRFTAQYRGKDKTGDLLPPWGIKNIAGATLSVRAISSGVRKALAIVEIVYASEGVDQ